MKTKQYIMLFLVFLNLAFAELLINKSIEYQKTIRELIHVSYDSELKQIEFGDYYGAAVVTVDGQDRLYTWGRNEHGELGIGDSSIPYADSPRLVYAAPRGTTIEQIETGDQYMGMLTNDGTDQYLYTWGRNSYYCLGYDTLGDNVYSPTKVDTSNLSGTEITDLSFGYKTSFLITQNNTYQYLYGWGYNGYGQLGNGNTTSQSSSIMLLRIPLASYEITDFDTNYNNSYMIIDGINGTSTLYGTGDNDFGQIGIPSTSYSRVTQWTSVYATSDSTISEVATSGHNVSFIVNSNNGCESILYSLGYNYYGQLGNGNNTSTYQIQTTISTTNQLSQLDLKGNIVTVIETDDNNSYYLGWGENGSGQLGLGIGAQYKYNIPQTLLTLDNSIQSISQKTVSYYNTSYVIENYNPSTGNSFQEVYFTGLDNYGQYGNGTVKPWLMRSRSPVLVAIIVPPSYQNTQQLDKMVTINENILINNSLQYTFDFTNLDNIFIN